MARNRCGIVITVVIDGTYHAGHDHADNAIASEYVSYYRAAKISARKNRDGEREII